MRLIRLIRQLYGLYTAKPNTINTKNNTALTRYLQTVKNFPKFERDIIAKVLKISKKKYVVDVDYIHSKNIYQNYIKKHKPILSINEVKVGDWLYIISKNYPVKGERFCEYYINSHWFREENRIFQVGDISGEYFYSVDGEIHGELGQVRFATEEEIENRFWEKIEGELMENFHPIPCE